MPPQDPWADATANLRLAQQAIHNINGITPDLPATAWQLRLFHGEIDNIRNLLEDLEDQMPPDPPLTDRGNQL